MDVDGAFDLSLKEDILIYLDKTDQVPHIFQKCKQILSQREDEGQVLSFGININIGDLTEVSSSLTSIILHDPDRAQGLFQEVVYITLKSLKHLPVSYSLPQIQVSPRVSNIPSLPCYIISIKELLKCNFESRYYTFHGLVCSKSPPQEYSKSTRYFCQAKECKGSQGNAFIRLYNRGCSESQVIRRDFQCVYCGRVLQEDAHARVLGEKVVLEMVNVCDRMEDIRQNFSITLRDDLNSSVKIGRLYSVVGIPEVDFYKENQVQVKFEVSSVTPLTKPSKYRCIPESINKFHHDLSGSPWRFSTGLAYIFASEIAPPGTFHLLKICILLSLVQTGIVNKINSRLDILAVGKEERIIERLFQYGAKFLSFCFCGNIHPLFPSVRESQFGTIIDGGAILLAGDGVCLLGDINLKKKETQEKITRVLQEKYLQVEVSKKGSESNKQFEQFAVESTLWAYQAKTDSTSDNISGSFRLVVNCDSQSASLNEFVYAQLCQDILVKAINPCSLILTESLTFEDLQQFLLTVAERNLPFSAEAETLLKGYFVTSRKIYEGSLKRRHFPFTTLQTLSSMAVAHAKLSLHEGVTEEDAVMAIHIFEECLAARFGPSFLNVHHQPHIKDDLSAQCGPENDRYMNEFQRQLKRFCSPSDTTGFSPFVNED